MYDAQQGSTCGAHIDLSTASGTNDFHGTGLRAPRHQLDQRRAVLLQERRCTFPRTRRTPSCTATSPAAPSAVRSSRTSSSASSPTSTCTSRIRRLATRFLNVPVGLERHHPRRRAISRTSSMPSIRRQRVDRAPTSTRRPTFWRSSTRPRFPASPAKWLDPQRHWLRQPIAHLTHYNAFLPGTGRFKADLAVANLDYNANHQRHRRAEVLLPARSHHCALRLLKRSRIHRASRLRRAGLLDQQHLPGQAEPQHHADLRLHAREELGQQSSSPSARRAFPAALRHGIHQHFRVDLFSRRVDRQCARRRRLRRRQSQPAS